MTMSLKTCGGLLGSMWCRNAPSFDDDKHRRGSTDRQWLSYKRLLSRLGMCRRGGKMLVVCITQGCHMISDHQDKFIPEFGQCTDLHTATGSAQQF